MLMNKNRKSVSNKQVGFFSFTPSMNIHVYSFITHTQLKQRENLVAFLVCRFCEIYYADI